MRPSRLSFEGDVVSWMLPNKRNVCLLVFLVNCFNAKQEREGGWRGFLVYSVYFRAVMLLFAASLSGEGRRRVQIHFILIFIDPSLR